MAGRLDRDESYVSRLEAGRYTLPADDIPLVLKAYRVSVGQFAARASEVKLGKRAA